MKKSIINSIKLMLDDYNEYVSRIKELSAQNKRLKEMLIELNGMEASDNIDKAKGAINSEMTLNDSRITEYTALVNSYDELIKSVYDESRDYKTELRHDAMNTFKTMLDNATSDYMNGYSYDVFSRQNERANTWLTKRMTYLDSIIDNPTAFATMINLGLGTLE